MNQYPRVLVAVPYHETKRYCLNATFDAIKSLTYKHKEVVIRFDPCEYGSQDAVKKQREFFRKYALDNNFDYLYFMGCDTIPPDDVIERLLITCEAQDIKINGGVYWGRNYANNGNPNRAVAWIHQMEQDAQTDTFLEPGMQIEVDGMGMDCVLIHRELLEKISFLDWKQNDDDYPFYDKARQLGYKVFINTDIQCKHYFSETGYSYLAKVVE